MQPLRSKYAIIIAIYRKNHPPFLVNCYLCAWQTYRTHSPKLRLLLVLLLKPLKDLIVLYESGIEFHSFGAVNGFTSL